MKILELCPFSAGVCGVWQRVLSESREFVKLGHEVLVFSSDIEKGTNRKAQSQDNIDGVQIKRFNATRSKLSENVFYFDFEQQLLNYAPDIVITHLLYPRSFQALEICKKRNIPCFLVTHAPFNLKRKFPLNLATNFYYNTKVKPNINQFTKIIAISKWELPYLSELGCHREKIVYIPNGTPEEFFKQKKTKPKKKRHVLFLGRIAPVKELETVIRAAKQLPDVNFSIVGSAERPYLQKLMQLIGNSKNIKIYSPIYDMKKKIRLIDEHKIFVLPSSREGMPQSLIEAMSRGKISLASSIIANKDLIKPQDNGFLFSVGDHRRLANLIKENIKENAQIKNNAIQTAKQYSWKNLIKSYEELFKQ